MYAFTFLFVCFLFLVIGSILTAILAGRSRTWHSEPLMLVSAVLLVLSFFVGANVYQNLEKIDEQRSRLEQIRR